MPYLLTKSKAVFPHIWHPSKAIITTASQYMVAAVSLERYLVICYKNVTSYKHIYYTLWVFVFSLVVNLPRFCEFEKFIPKEETNLLDPNLNNGLINEANNVRKANDTFSLLYHTSRMGENPDWLLFMAYHEISLIIFCSLLISYCNFQVWVEVGKSSQINKHRYCN